jgi:signal transduction histidine kinase
MQIRVRLTLQFILIAAGILAAAFLYVYIQFKLNLKEEFYDNLQSRAVLIADIVAGNKTDEQEFRLPGPSSLSGHIIDYPENISIYSMQERRLYMLNPAPDHIPSSTFQEIRKTGTCHFTNGKYSALGLLYHNRVGAQYVVIAESVFDQMPLHSLIRILLIVFLLSIALVATGGWFFSRQALSPVSAIMNQVDALLPADLSQRLKTDNQGDELSRLVITFNKLLDRIHQAFSHQKAFLSNISHELKNPLNVMVSQIEVTLDKERSQEEYQHTLSSVLADVKELNDVAEKLMQMAQINADESAIRFQPIRIDELIWQSKENLVKTHPDYRISFDVISLPEQEDHLLVSGNEQLLKTAIINLMENGCKFSPDHAVRVSLSFDGQEKCSVKIEDHGPGIPENELPMIFEPFYRSPKTSSIKGSGIGLSLVNAILRLHRIDIQVESQTGFGTTFILLFPKGGQKPD